jgi:hypothetical protein
MGSGSFLAVGHRGNTNDSDLGYWGSRWLPKLKPEKYHCITMTHGQSL